MRIVGLMSGTSADGVDAALVDVTWAAGARPIVETRSWLTVPYSSSVRNDILAACDPAMGTIDRVSRLNVVLGELFSVAARAVVDQAGLPMDAIDLIASHGQTIFHGVDPTEPVRSTLQITSSAVIAERTGRTVVSDFRSRDVAAGGQGAPLVSYADYLLFADPTRSRAVQNIGGIGNVTYLPAGCGPDDVVSFDTGPGTMVIDALTRDRFGVPFDRDGLIARVGRVDDQLVAQFLDDPYFALSPPKTTGRERFGQAYSRRFGDAGEDRGLDDADLIASATALTARSIADAYARFAPDVDEVILSGGGSSNPTLVTFIGESARSLGLLSSLRSVDEFGLSPDAKEAIVFAILGFETIHGRSGVLPSCTGASHPVVLGSIVPGDNYLALMSRVIAAGR